MAFYERNSATSETFTYVQQIENFSVRFCRGSSITSSREHGGCEWTFTLSALGDEALNAMLTRVETRNHRSPSFVKIKLFIVDCFSRNSLHAEKNIRFECFSYTENVLHLKKDYLLNGNCGLNQLLYVPNDVLTLKWEVTTYEYSNDSFDGRREAFENSSRIPAGGFLKKPVVRYLLRFLVLFSLYAILAALGIMVVIKIYGFTSAIITDIFQEMMIFMTGIISAIGNFLSFCYGMIVLIVIVMLLSWINKQFDNRNSMRLTQIERKQIALPSNRGVAMYETLRSMTYGNSRPIRYNQRYYYRIQ